MTDSLPRSCRYCAAMVCGDINYCEGQMTLEVENGD